MRMGIKREMDIWVYGQVEQERERGRDTSYCQGEYNKTQGEHWGISVVRVTREMERGGFQGYYGREREG